MGQAATARRGWGHRRDVQASRARPSTGPRQGLPIQDGGPCQAGHAQPPCEREGRHTLGPAPARGARSAALRGPEGARPSWAWRGPQPRTLVRDHAVRLPQGHPPPSSGLKGALPFALDRTPGGAPPGLPGAAGRGAQALQAEPAASLDWGPHCPAASVAGVADFHPAPSQAPWEFLEDGPSRRGASCPSGAGLARLACSPVSP